MARTTLLVLLLAGSALILGCQDDTTPLSPTAHSPDHPSAIVKTLALGSRGAGGHLDGAALHGANGLALTDDGRLHVGSLFGREIAEVATADGSLLGRLDATDGVEGVDDLARGPDGSLWWSNFWTGEVVRMGADRSLRVVDIGPGAGPLAVDADGRAYVARRFLGTGIHVIDPDPAVPPRLLADPGNVGGLALDGRGWLYASLWNDGTIVRMRTDASWPLVATVARDFQVPAGIAFDAKGALVVVEHMTGDVWKLVLRTVDEPDIDPDDPFNPPDETDDLALKVQYVDHRERIASLEPGLAYVEPDPRGHLFVANSQDGTVTKLYSWGYRRTVCPGGLILPGGVAVADDGLRGGAIWIADAWSLRAFDLTTGDACGLHRCMMAVNGFTAPMTAHRSDGEVVVSSWMGKVQVLDPVECEVVETHDLTAETPLNAIRYGDVLVATSLTNGSVFSLDSRTVYADGLSVPAGLATDGRDLWVADRATGSVWHVARDGDALAAPRLVIDGLDAPEGMAWIAPRHLLVVETGADRLIRVDTMRGTIGVVAADLDVGLEAPPGMPTTWQFNGVTKGAGNTAYVTSDIANRIYEITLPDAGWHGEFEEGETDDGDGWSDE